MIESNSIECNSIESIEHNSIDTSNLTNQQFRLNKISEIEYYFIAEIKERELMSKKLSKYISLCDYFDKSLIVLSVTSPWELMDLQTKNDSDKTEDIHIPFDPF